MAKPSAAQEKKPQAADRDVGRLTIAAMRLQAATAAPDAGKRFGRGRDIDAGLAPIRPAVEGDPAPLETPIAATLDREKFNRADAGASTIGRSEVSSAVGVDTAGKVTHGAAAGMEGVWEAMATDLVAARTAPDNQTHRG